MCTRQPCEEILYEDGCRLRDDQHVGTGVNVWCPHQQLGRNLSLIPELSIFPEIKQTAVHLGQQPEETLSSPPGRRQPEFAHP